MGMAFICIYLGDQDITIFTLFHKSYSHDANMFCRLQISCTCFRKVTKMVGFKSPEPGYSSGADMQIGATGSGTINGTRCFLIQSILG